MSKEPEWSHRDSWIKRADSFAVEVRRWTDMRYLGYDCGEQVSRLVNVWNVYAYIYPAHPHFKNLSLLLKECRAAANILPLHGGVTYYKFTNDCVTIGSDYNHYGDEYHRYSSRREDATEQFDDAEELFQFLQHHDNPAFKMNAGKWEGHDETGL